MTAKNAAVVSLILVALLVGIWVVGWLAATSRAAEESAQRALLVEASRLLAEYDQVHGEYPDSLKGLAFTYPDGGDASLLSEFKYESDGKSYSITTVGASTGELLSLSNDKLADKL